MFNPSSTYNTLTSTAHDKRCDRDLVLACALKFHLSPLRLRRLQIQAMRPRQIKKIRRIFE